MEGNTKENSKANFNIWINIGLMFILLIGITICVFLTSRDLFYAIQTFFGTHQNEDVSLLYVSSFGFEAAILIYAISNKKAWQDYVFVVASCALNTTYLWYEASNKSGVSWAHYVSAVILGCTFPLIVVWLSVLFRGYFWATVDIKEQSYKEEILSQQLSEKVLALETEKIGLVQENESLVQIKSELVQANEQLVQENKQLVQDKLELVQMKLELVQEKSELVQVKLELVQVNEKLVQEKSQLVQANEKFVQVNLELVQANEKLVQENLGLVQERLKSEQMNQDLVQQIGAIRNENEKPLAEHRLLQEQNKQLEKSLSDAKAKQNAVQNEHDVLRKELESARRKKLVVHLIEENMEVAARLTRNWKNNKDSNEVAANTAYSEFKKLIEGNITLEN